MAKLLQVSLLCSLLQLLYSPHLALEFIQTLGKTEDAPMETDTPAKPAEEAAKSEPPAAESSAVPPATDDKKEG